MQCVLSAIDGFDGGIMPGWRDHKCDECWHEKRYSSDNDGAVGSGYGVAGGEANPDVEIPSVSPNIMPFLWQYYDGIIPSCLRCVRSLRIGG